MRRKTKLYSSWVLLVSIVMIFGYLTIWIDRNFTVYNSNFKVLRYSISGGEDFTFHKGRLLTVDNSPSEEKDSPVHMAKLHTVYKGSQTVGRIRTKLKHKFGLKFIGDSTVSTAIRTAGRRVFVLRYRGSFPFEELDDLRAVLTDDISISKELAVWKISVTDENTFTRGWTLPRLPTSNDSFRIDFRLKSADDPIASCKLGELYRQENGI